LKYVAWSTSKRRETSFHVDLSLPFISIENARKLKYLGTKITAHICGGMEIKGR
jgi:hypothetical protein